jgi:uncharacterized protein (TIGR03067 family)
MKLFNMLTMSVAMLFVGFAGAEDKKPIAFDATKLVGTWQITGGKKDGADASKEGIESTKLVVEKEKMTLKTSIGDFVMKYTVDAKTMPVSLDLEITDGPDKDAKGTKAKGIVSIDGDTVKIAYHPIGGARPKNFDAKKDSGEFSFTMKREVKKDKK